MKNHQRERLVGYVYPTEPTLVILIDPYGNVLIEQDHAYQLAPFWEELQD